MLIKKPFKKGMGPSIAPYYKAAGGAATTTFNPADKAANITLSNGNLTATDSSGFAAVRGIASHTTGLYYYEIVVSVSANVGLNVLGIGNASAGLVNFTGSDNNAIGYAGSGSVWLNNANPTGSPIQTYAVGDTVCVAVDMGNTKIWFRTNGGNWNNAAIGSQNPATNTGGISFATMGAGPWFPMANGATASDAFTANFGATAYAQTPPAGFGNW